MRPIKFRVWDKTNKQMHYLGELERATLTLGGDDLILITHNDHHVDGSEPLSDIELMQFTGIKDKQGREIFEGDILGVSDPTDTSRAIVVFHEAAFKPQLFRFAHIFDKSWFDWVVIGNKHENPELIPEEL